MPTHVLMSTLTHLHTHLINTLNPLPERRSQVRPQVSDVPLPLTPGLLHQRPHCWSPQAPPWSSNQPSLQPQHIPPPSFLSSLKTKNFSKRSLLREKEKNNLKKKNNLQVLEQMNQQSQFLILSRALESSHSLAWLVR